MAANSPEVAPRLPSELVALIHHVELSEAGWRDELLDRLVLSSLYLHGTPLSLDELRSGLGSDFGLATEDSTCHQSVERLLASDRLVEVADGRLRLAHQATVEAGKAIAENQALEERVAERFKVIVAEESSKVDPEDAWCRFRDECLDPLVKELGARTYELISSPEGKGADVQSVAAYTDSYALDVQESIKRTIDRFLDPADIDVRSFVLSRLHSHFLTLAASLSKRSLLELTKKRKSNLQLTLFLDTNFLFSALDLHDNPANLVAKDLIRILGRVRNHVRSKLYVFPLTVDEVVSTLTAFTKELSNTTIDPRLGKIARNTSVGQGNGIGSRFLRAVATSSHRLTVEDYFSPYIKNLVAVLRGNGLEFYNESVDDLTASQEVIDDILSEQEFQSNRSSYRQKSYTALRHDVTLWHFASKKRMTRVNSPLDAVYWVVTVDHRFLGFDRFKSRKNNFTSVPVCVHPAMLIQILQLWAPRTTQLDETMLQCVRAFLPHSHESDVEGVTLRILRSLSRFEEVNDLPEDVVSAVLLDRAVRERMGEVSESNEQIDVIRDAVVGQLTAAQEKTLVEAEERVRAETENRMRATHDRQLRYEQEGRSEVQNQLQESKERLGRFERQSQELKRTTSELKRELHSERVSRQSLEGGIANLSSQSSSLRSELQRHQEFRNTVHRASFVAVASVVLAVALVGSIPVIRWVIGGTQGLGTGALTGVWLVLIAVWMVGSDYIGQQMSAIRSWNCFVQFCRLKKWIMGIFGIVLGGVLTKYIWEHW